MTNSLLCVDLTVEYLYALQSDDITPSVNPNGVFFAISLFSDYRLRV